MVQSVWRTAGIETRHQNQQLACISHIWNNHKTPESKPLLVGFDDCSLDTVVFLFYTKMPQSEVVATGDLNETFSWYFPWERHWYKFQHCLANTAKGWQSYHRQYMVLFLSIHTRTFSSVLFGTSVVDSDQFSSFIVSCTALCWISLWPVLPDTSHVIVTK